MFITWGSYSQKYDYKYSIHLGSEYSKGLEIRGEFDNWYMAFYAESMILENKNVSIWGAELGLFNKINDVTILYGFNIGILRAEASKPLYGVNLGLDYNVNENFFIGLKLNYSGYLERSDNKEITTEKLFRPMIKIGLKF